MTHEEPIAERNKRRRLRQYELDRAAYGPLVADALAVVQRHASSDPQCPAPDNVIRDALAAAAAGRPLPGAGEPLPAEELYERRVDLGWSQARMADALREVMGGGTYPSLRTYQMIEAGQAPMPAQIELHLAQVAEREAG